ncbi:MAG: hypothetical protein IRY90_02255 [Actinomadura rubrobrunea]|nr:hypothetical protein [Actinomadura rubrobrunea]
MAAATRLGRYDEAAALLRLPVPPSTFQTQFGLFYLYERGVYHLATDRIAAAIADFGRCGELARRWDVDLPAALPWRLGLAQAHLAVGERDVARGLIEEQKGLSCQGGGRTRALTMVCEGMLADPAARVRILQDAVRLLEADGDVFELARTKRLLSSAFEELGETERARSAARQAGELAARCQAEWLLFDLTVDGEPALSGARVPRWRVDTLSKAEQKVATLAAQGHTNREIGATLFITVSTVEQHLTRVYRKLQVKRRTDLPAALQRYAAARGALSFHDRPLEDLPGDPLRDCG